MSRAVATLLLLAAAGHAAVPLVSYGQDAASSPSVRLVTSAACSACSIRLMPEVTLGAGTEEWGGVSRGWVVRDGRGRFYHAAAYTPFVLLAFDSLGRFLQTIGRQGAGPGEFTNIGRALVGRGDTLRIFDQAARTYTVITPEYSTAGATTLGPRVTSAVELRPGELIVSADMPTRERAGQPLHRVIGNELRAALGSTGAPTRSRPAPLELLRRLARHSDTTFWAAHATQYIIELRTADGRLLRSLHRDVARDASWFRQADRNTPEGRLNPVLHAIEQDTMGLLWLLFTVRDPRWRQRVAAGGGPPGMQNVQSTTGDLFDLMDSILEVVDPERGEVLATFRSDRVIDSFAGAGRVVIYTEDDLGVGRLVVHRVQLHRTDPPSHE